MTNKKDDLNALVSSDLFAEICPKHHALAKAMQWRKEHTAHVGRLEESATLCHVPCNEDLPHPELWKAESWKWLRKFFPEDLSPTELWKAESWPKEGEG